VGEQQQKQQQEQQQEQQQRAQGEIAFLSHEPTLLGGRTRPTAGGCVCVWRGGSNVCARDCCCGKWSSTLS
jgi:hypothetical protein